jgi:hypothetical protein
MEVLRNWTAKRSDNYMTIVHATGKVIRVKSISAENGQVIATDHTGKRYELHVGASDLRVAA